MRRERRAELLCGRQNGSQLSLLSCLFLPTAAAVFYRRVTARADRFNPSVHLWRSHYPTRVPARLRKSPRRCSAKASHLRLQSSVIFSLRSDAALAKWHQRLSSPVSLPARHIRYLWLCVWDALGFKVDILADLLGTAMELLLMSCTVNIGLWWS